MRPTHVVIHTFPTPTSTDCTRSQSAFVKNDRLSAFRRVIRSPTFTLFDSTSIIIERIIRYGALYEAYGVDKFDIRVIQWGHANGIFASSVIKIS